MPTKKPWFKKAIVEKKPNTLDGWRKEMPADKRRADAISSRPANWSNKKKYLSVARALQALANVTTDPETKKTAKQDADYFFAKAKGKNKMQVGGSISDHQRTEHYRYLNIQKVKDGLKLSLNEEGIEEVKSLKEDGKSDFDIWSDLFDDVQGNSEYLFHPDMGESGFGLTSAEGITDGYHYGDQGGYETDYPESAKIYWFPNYMVESSIDTMLEEGSVIFTEAKAAGGYMAKGGKVKGKPIHKDYLALIEKEATQPDADKYKYRYKVLFGQDVVLKEDLDNRPIEKYSVKNSDEGYQLAEILNYNAKVKQRGGYMKEGGEITGGEFAEQLDGLKEYLSGYVKARNISSQEHKMALEVLGKMSLKAETDPEFKKLAYKWLTVGGTIVLWELYREMGYGNIVNDPYPYDNFNVATLLDTVAMYYHRKDKTFGAGKFEHGGTVHGEMVVQMTQGYLSAVLFTETDDDQEPLDKNYSITDFDAETIVKVKTMISQYIMENLDAIKASGLDYETIGNDIWYAQSGQGAGFFDHNLDKDVEDKLTNGATKFVDLSAHVFAQDGEVYIEGGWFSKQFEKGGFVKLNFNSHKSHNPEYDILEGYLDGDTMITYAIKVKGDNIGKESMEYYSGVNYVSGSNKKSLSRHYESGQIPAKYKSKWLELKNLYETKKFEQGGTVKGFISKFLDLSVLNEKIPLNEIFTKKIE